MPSVFQSAACLTASMLAPPIDMEQVEVLNVQDNRDHTETVSIARPLALLTLCFAQIADN